MGWCGDSSKSSKRHATEEQIEGQENGEAEGLVIIMVDEGEMES